MPVEIQNSNAIQILAGNTLKLCFHSCFQISTTLEQFQFPILKNQPINQEKVLPEKKFNTPSTTKHPPVQDFKLLLSIFKAKKNYLKIYSKSKLT